MISVSIPSYIQVTDMVPVHRKIPDLITPMTVLLVSYQLFRVYTEIANYCETIFSDLNAVSQKDTLSIIVC